MEVEGCKQNSYAVALKQLASTTNTCGELTGVINCMVTIKHVRNAGNFTSIYSGSYSM